jgi:hypothetical protein
MRLTFNDSNDDNGERTRYSHLNVPVRQAEREHHRVV